MVLLDLVISPRHDSCSPHPRPSRTSLARPPPAASTPSPEILSLSFRPSTANTIHHLIKFVYARVMHERIALPDAHSAPQNLYAQKPPSFRAHETFLPFNFMFYITLLPRRVSYVHIIDPRIEFRSVFGRPKRKASDSPDTARRYPILLLLNTVYVLYSCRL